MHGFALDDAGFESVLLRGHTAFALTRDFDRWSEQDVSFVFGIMAHDTFRKKAQSIPEESWLPFDRGDGTESKRAQQTNVRQRVVEEKGFKELVDRFESGNTTRWSVSFP